MSGNRPIDSYCDYGIFSARIEGKVPCLEFGKETDLNANQGEITGITFQKVDNGIVKPVLHSDDFSQVDWPNAPTRYGQQQNNVFKKLDVPVIAAPRKWHDFANLLLHLKEGMINQMTPADGLHPTTLYEGLLSDVWRGGVGDSRRATSYHRQLTVIKQILDQHWVNCFLAHLAISRVDDKDYEKLVGSVLTGFCDGQDDLKILFENLLDLFRFGVREIKQSCTVSSRNKTMCEGVVHCLTYGYHPDQMELEHQGLFEGRGRLKQRVLLPKALGNSERSRSRSSSRSRSPSPESSLPNHVENINNPNMFLMTMHDMLQNPNNYVLGWNQLHEYFEPHKPDMIIFSYRKDKIKAEVLVVVSSYVRYGYETSFTTHLSRSTEQCVRQCLAALSVNQREIKGLVLVPDGIKMIKVQKQIRNENIVYAVHETDLIQWHETLQLYALLYDLQEDMD